MEAAGFMLESYVPHEWHYSHRPRGGRDPEKRANPQRRRGRLPIRLAGKGVAPLASPFSAATRRPAVGRPRPTRTRRALGSRSDERGQDVMMHDPLYRRARHGQRPTHCVGTPPRASWAALAILAAGLVAGSARASKPKPAAPDVMPAYAEAIVTGTDQLIQQAGCASCGGGLPPPAAMPMGGGWGGAAAVRLLRRHLRQVACASPARRNRATVSTNARTALSRGSAAGSSTASAARTRATRASGITRPTPRSS